MQGTYIGEVVELVDAKCGIIKFDVPTRVVGGVAYPTNPFREVNIGDSVKLELVESPQNSLWLYTLIDTTNKIVLSDMERERNDEKRTVMTLDFENDKVNIQASEVSFTHTKDNEIFYASRFSEFFDLVRKNFEKINDELNKLAGIKFTATTTGAVTVTPKPYINEYGTDTDYIGNKNVKDFEIID